MKTKLKGILTLLLALVVQISFAQEKTVSGTVSDSSGNLPGVSVLIKGTKTGTETDFNGKYTIKAKVGDILSFSYVGYKTSDKKVGASNTIDVLLEEEAGILDEVVITALGISRDKKSLGYSTQQVSGDAVNTARETNFVNSLSGKIAGLDIKKSNTIGGSTNVIIRGYSSISQNNQALFVIDGIPISNDNYNTGGQQTGGNGYDYGNAASDINPDDIESINVLKGAAATSLYGSRASNGVILIVTKKGKKQKGIGVTINSSVIASKFDASTFPEFQFEYGAGYGPYYGPGDGFFYRYDFNGDGTVDSVVPSTEDASFGAPFDGRPVFQWNSFYPQLSTFNQATPWVAPKNGPASFFETGYNYINSVSLSSGNENGSYRLSYTKSDTDGILPNSTLIKNTIDFNGSAKLSEKFTASAKATYIETKAVGRYGTGYDAENVMTNFRQWWQTNVDLKEQKDAYFSTRQNISWNPHDENDLSPIYWDNPYWTRYENFQNDKRNRLIGNFSLNYDATEWFSVLARASVDTYTDLAEERNNIGSVDLSQYTRRNRSFTEYNYDLLLNFDKKINDNIGFRGVLGSNTRQTFFSGISASTNGGLVLPSQYTLSNSANPINFPDETETNVKVIGLFANASFDYGNKFFLEGSIRRDQHSTLPSSNNTYYYYSGSGSYIFSKDLNVDWLTFGKLRAGYAEVGNGGPSYAVNNTFNAIAGFGGNTLYSNPGTSQNPNLKEERTKSLEIGLETTFAKNRYGIDLSYYDNRTKDLITAVEVTAATGFTNRFVNAGEIKNSGIEASAFAVPFQNDNFEWKVNVNWSKNESEVVSLFEDTKNLLLSSFFGVTINATVGQPYGIIKGTDYVYENGQRVVRADGKYMKTSSRQEVLGDINPEWKGGISNMFKYKNIALSFLIDMQKGGSIFSGDMYFGLATGLYKETAGLNDLGNPLRNPVTAGNDSGGVILDGVQADGSVNTVRADFTAYDNPYGRYGNAPDKQFVYDASYVKLREVTLSYSLPKKTLEKLPFTEVTLSATGRNLWIISKNLPYADPEAGFSSGNVQGVQIGAYPSTKDYSFNVKLQF